MIKTFDISDRIEVYGSNLAGINGKGHALFCKKYFGAIDGIGEGISGQCYALPTKDENIVTRSLEDIDESIKKFHQFSIQNESLNFFVGKIGTGLASYKDSDILPLLKKYDFPENVYFAGLWDRKLKPNKEIRLIIAGGRDFTDFNMLCDETDKSLEIALSKGFKPVIVSGTARGADAMGEKYANLRGYDIVRFPAPWNEFKNKFNKNAAAGYVRNQWMAQYSHALLAFHDGESKGTSAMIDLANSMGLKTKIVKYNLNLKLDF